MTDRTQRLRDLVNKFPKTWIVSLNLWPVTKELQFWTFPDLATAEAFADKHNTRLARYGHEPLYKVNYD